MVETRRYKVGKLGGLSFPAAVGRRWAGSRHSYPVDFIDISIESQETGLFIPGHTSWQLVAAAFPEAELYQRANRKSRKGEVLDSRAPKNKPNKLYTPRYVDRAGLMKVLGSKFTWGSLAVGQELWLTSFVSGVVARTESNEPDWGTIVPVEFFEGVSGAVTL